MSQPLGLDPRPPAVNFDDALDQRQADPGAFGLGAQALEEPEDLVMVPRLDADAVVADVEDGLPSLMPATHFDA